MLGELGFEIDFLVASWWFFLLLIWIVVRVTVGYRGVNTFSFFFPLLLITNGLFIPFGKNINSLITGIDIFSYERYWFALLLMYLFIPVGILLANLSGRFGNKKPAPYIHLKPSSRIRIKFYVAAVLIISVVSILQIFYQGLAFDYFSYVTGNMDNESYIAHRVKFGEIISSSNEFYLYQKLLYGIAPLAILIVANMQMKLWKKHVFFLVLLFATMQSGHKAPLVIVLAYIFISHILIKKNLMLSRKDWGSLSSFSVFVIFVVLPMFYFMQGIRDYGIALFWSVERLVFEPQRTLQLFFEVYPEHHPYLWGMSSKILSTVFGVQDFIPPSVYIPRNLLGFESTSFPTLFIGEAWADFGYAGVIVTSVLVGILLQSYNIWFYEKKEAFLDDVALFLSIVFGALYLLESNFLTSLLTFGLLLNSLIYLLIRHPSRKIRLSGLKDLEIGR